ncbi:MAG: FkbM family methyltransferase [Lachnospiraceae bacterium]|nr:FkbM family methyltransferase [Lachnospiraceae bacterium]
MKHIDKDNIPTELYEMPVVMYGAGSAGRTIIPLLIEKGIVIKYIIDDAENIQGTYIEDVEVISYHAFAKCSKAFEDVAVIVTTIYGKTVSKKLESFQNIHIYELYDWLCELTGDKKWIMGMIAETENLQKMKRQIEALKDKWADEESTKVLAGLVKYLDTMDFACIAEVCTTDEHYFIPEVKNAMKDPLVIIDAGACRGELLQSIKNNHLNCEKCYCFEVDEDNYRFLSEQTQRVESDIRKICLNKGLWSESKELYFEEGGDSASGKVVLYETDYVINAVSIDDYFGEEKCNYIKMDIEGAELPALAGGIRLIKRERPILAISIYHSLEDFWKIPQYLMRELDNYRYYVRHHSLIFGETVLYGVPAEL